MNTPEHEPEAAEHAEHPDMRTMLDTELQNPFHKDPVAFLDGNPNVEQNAFRASDTRILRTAGSGILKDPDQWAQQLADYVCALEQENGNGTQIEVELEAHDTCGAGGLKRPDEQNTDDPAHADIEGIAQKLQALGINATCPKQRSPMNGLSVHNALGVTIDMTQGSRMQCPPFNSFALSSPDADAFPVEALTAGQISSKPLEQHGHGYGNLLSETGVPYTYLVYVDPSQPQSAARVQAIREKVEELHTKGINVRVIERQAPNVTQKVPVKKVVVRCMDERCNAA
ncbi:MAG: hypothetical protein ABIG34_03765 [Candidatus Peregrinibacteria bacterium]